MRLQNANAFPNRTVEPAGKWPPFSSRSSSTAAVRRAKAEHRDQVTSDVDQDLDRDLEPPESGVDVPVIRAKFVEVGVRQRAQPIHHFGQLQELRLRLLGQIEIAVRALLAARRGSEDPGGRYLGVAPQFACDRAFEFSERHVA